MAVQVLSAAYDGTILPSPLQFGETVSDKVRAPDDPKLCHHIVELEASCALSGQCHEVLINQAGCLRQVEKQCANWYSLDVSQEQMDAGFIISAHSTGGSKFKLLMFEHTPEGGNELVAQVRLARLHPLCWQQGGEHVDSGIYGVQYVVLQHVNACAQAMDGLNATDGVHNDYEFRGVPSSAVAITDVFSSSATV